MNFLSKHTTFHSRKCPWKISSAKWRPFCPGGDELIVYPSRSRHVVYDIYDTVLFLEGYVIISQGSCGTTILAACSNFSLVVYGYEWYLLMRWRHSMGERSKDLVTLTMTQKKTKLKTNKRRKTVNIPIGWITRSKQLLEGTKHWKYYTYTF